MLNTSHEIYGDRNTETRYFYYFKKVKSAFLLRWQLQECMNVKTGAKQH